jgi:hypothetical protein
VAATVSDGSFEMRKTVVLLLLAAMLVVVGCGGPAGDVDRYVRNHEPKTGGSDL